jgi:hypothetical protein
MNYINEDKVNIDSFHLLSLKKLILSNQNDFYFNSGQTSKKGNFGSDISESCYFEKFGKFLFWKSEHTSFQNQKTYSTGTPPNSVTAGDFDHDTKLDIVTKKCEKQYLQTSVLVGDRFSSLCHFISI